MRFISSFVFCSLVIGIGSAQADSAWHESSGQSGSEISVSPPLANERLSDWLVRHRLHLRPDSMGLIWQVPNERHSQSVLQQDLLAEISRSKALGTAAKTQWIEWVRALPVTGRVNLPATDARWMQAHPSQDPVLSTDHRLILPLKETTVVVMSLEGRFCKVTHTAGAQARDYVQACAIDKLNEIDHAWLIQPDGFVQKVAINFWNAQDQGELAPGAIIWAPSANEEILGKLSELMTVFLATQSYDSVLKAASSDRLSVALESPVAVARVARSSPITSNDWGVVGLLQTPTARMADAGEMRFNLSGTYPYVRSNVFAQPFDWLEAGFRYTKVTNRLYGPEELSGTQKYIDKSIDFKVKLVPEALWIPQVAVGMIDFGGTGLFASEYLVANKRYGHWDGSLGIGWGYLGASRKIPNPLGKLSAAFNTRSADFGMGGTPAVQSFFRGPTALFGGVQYHAPWSKWVLKAEYDGNDYRSEPLANNLQQALPLNFGAVYQVGPSIDLSFALERGNKAMVGLTLHTSAAKLGNAKVSDPPAPKVHVFRPLQEPEWTGTASDIAAVSRWGVISMQQVSDTLRVEMEGVSGAHWNERIDRIVSVLHKNAPASIDTFELLLTERGVLLSERRIHRPTWVTQNTQLVPPSAKVQSVVSVEPDPKKMDKSQEFVWRQTPSNFGYSVIPSWQQNIGGPDAFILFRAGVAFPMQFKISESTRLSASVNLNIFDNFGQFKYTAPSRMPRVRTNLRQYMTDSRFNLTNLQLSHLGEAAPNHYYGVYGGYLESMYAGLGAEWLYRPWHSPFAWGVDVNRVQQRNFDQLLGFGRAGTQTGYKVTTGHASAYWDTGWQDTQVKVSVGRYLAGDFGANIDLSKTFKNGVSVGVWATKTNVSAEQFGEGSFDKGLYLKIPFDVMATLRTGAVANIVYNPLTRDGGAKLNRDFSLYGETTARSLRESSFVPASPRPVSNGQ